MLFHYEKIILPYQRKELDSWKLKEPNVVPEFALRWNGPGVSNGYGFGEWKTEQYFRRQGFYVFNNEFNLFSQRSKFNRYNEYIKSMVTPSKLKTFQETVQQLIKQNYPIENLDLFVFNLDTCFFVEVKKEKDTLREPQIRFMYLAQSILETECKLVYLSDTETIGHSETVTGDNKLPLTI